MNDYQKEQLAALRMIRPHLGAMASKRRRRLQQSVLPYLGFRSEVDRFLGAHVESVCTAACYQDRRSACCSKDGIITFFADHVINALTAADASLGMLEKALTGHNRSGKCVYLTPRGCCWTVRPLVCAMFLCDQALAVLAVDAAAASCWDQLRERAKSFRWPDRPVLFDTLEQVFIDAGERSTLMYLNSSPGLLRIKRRAGLSLPES